MEGLSELTLFLRDSVSEAHTIIQRTAALNQVPVEFTTSDKIFGSIDGSNEAYRTELRLGGLVVSNGKGSDKKASKRDAAEKAIVIMKVSHLYY